MFGILDNEVLPVYGCPHSRHNLLSTMFEQFRPDLIDESQLGIDTGIFQALIDSMRQSSRNHEIAIPQGVARRFPVFVSGAENVPVCESTKPAGGCRPRLAYDYTNGGHPRKKSEQVITVNVDNGIGRVAIYFAGNDPAAILNGLEDNGFAIDNDIELGTRYNACFRELLAFQPDAGNAPVFPTL